MLSGMDGYKSGIVTAWIVFFLAARLCFIATHGFMPALEHGWWSAIVAASVLCWLWPLPVLGIVALLVWLLPQPRYARTGAPS
jgi:hypothetical protein